MIMTVIIIVTLIMAMIIGFVVIFLRRRFNDKAVETEMPLATCKEQQEVEVDDEKKIDENFHGSETETAQGFVKTQEEEEEEENNTKEPECKIVDVMMDKETIAEGEKGSYEVTAKKEADTKLENKEFKTADTTMDEEKTIECEKEEFDVFDVMMDEETMVQYQKADFEVVDVTQEEDEEEDEETNTKEAECKIVDVMMDKETIGEGEKGSYEVVDVTAKKEADTKWENKEFKTVDMSEKRTMAEQMRRRPKTKIVCTLGPASRSVEMVEKLLRAGMNVARFNFSHGSHEYHQETLDNLRQAMDNTGILCAVMLDTKGPEIRTGFLNDGKPIRLTKGQEITVTTDYDIKGDETMISMSYKKLAYDAKPQSVVLCADGTITLTVLSCDTEAGTVRCRCENSALLGERKNVNLPGVIVDLPTLTEKDKVDILEWGVPNKIDMIALSFVRKGSDLTEVRNVLGEHAKKIMLMSKVENQEGVANFDDILANSDAFMVARGDLGMEIPIEKIFYAQKAMIFKCNVQGKPVVTATQMLESMIKSPRPTRAEATDVANAVLDGTDCVMLSGETAAGAYPELAVQTMAKICIEAESYVDYGMAYKTIMKQAPVPMSPLESLASSAAKTANSASATLIIVLTRGGSSARLVAKYRPSMPILSVVVPEIITDSFDWSVSDEAPARHSLIFRGLIPVLSSGSTKASHSEATEQSLEFAIQHAKDMGLCKTGDSVVALHRVGVASVIKLLTVK